MSLSSDVTVKDLRHLFSLSENDFIVAAYRELLGREPDTDATVNCRRLLAAGLPYEAVLFMIAESEEFGGRFLIRDMYAYRKKYKSYYRRKFMKRIPVLGWLYKMLANIYHMDSLLAEIKYMSAQVQNDMEAKLNELEAHTERISGQFDLIDRRIARVESQITDVTRGQTDVLTDHMDNRAGMLEQHIARQKANLTDVVKTTADTLMNHMDNRSGMLEQHIERQEADLTSAVKTTADVLVSHMDNRSGMLERQISEGLADIGELTKVGDNSIIEGQTRLSQSITAHSNELKHSLDVQCILSEGLPPSPGHESLQAEFLRLLPDRTDEFEAYGQLPIEKLVDHISGETVVAAHYSRLIIEYAVSHGLSSVEHIGIEPGMLPGRCKQKDTLIIANPALSALVLSSPELLGEISRQLNDKLVLSVWATPSPIYLVWHGFSHMEKRDKGMLFRWAEGNHGAWQIEIINTSLTAVYAELEWVSDSMQGCGELLASCCGTTAKAELNSQRYFGLTVCLLPGKNDLSLAFTGQARYPGNADNRKLAFRIENLTCEIDGRLIEQRLVYQSSHPGLHDAYIRKQLHATGFVDVTADNYANHGFYMRELPKSKLPQPHNMSDYRYIESEYKDYPPNSIILYTAHRFRHSEGI